MLGLVKNPTLHYTTKAAARLDVAMLQKILESFVIHVKIKSIFAGIDATGFGHGQLSFTTQNVPNYTGNLLNSQALSDMNQQLICAIKIRHRTRHDSIDFVSLLQKTNGVIPIDTVVADKG